MREILFRGKRKDTGEWVQGFMFGRYDPHKMENVVYRARIDNGTCFDTPDEVIPETIGQYTGLNDKSGNKIFEGDIVRQTYPQEYVGVPRQKPNIGVVEFAEGAFGVHIYESNSLISKGTQFFFQYAIEREVIGNIHENKELLYGGDPQ